VPAALPPARSTHDDGWCFPQVAKPKSAKANMGKAEYDRLEAIRTKEEKAARLAEAEKKRLKAKELEMDAIKKQASREKLPSELNADDGPMLISMVVGKALGIANSDKLKPAEMLELVKKQLNDVDVEGKAPKPALLVFAGVITERKAAKAAKEAEKKRLKDEEKAAKLAVEAAKKEARAAEAAAEVVCPSWTARSPTPTYRSYQQACSPPATRCRLHSPRSVRCSGPQEASRLAREAKLASGEPEPEPEKKARPPPFHTTPAL
jgi:hypothetical protein